MEYPEWVYKQSLNLKITFVSTKNEKYQFFLTFLTFISFTYYFFKFTTFAFNQDDSIESYVV